MRTGAAQVSQPLKQGGMVRQSKFPESLSRVFVLNAPRLFSGVWAMIKVRPCRPYKVAQQRRCVGAQALPLRVPLAQSEFSGSKRVLWLDCLCEFLWLAPHGPHGRTRVPVLPACAGGPMGVIGCIPRASIARGCHLETLLSRVHARGPRMGRTRCDGWDGWHGTRHEPKVRMRMACMRMACMKRMMA